MPPWGITENLSWSSGKILTFEARPTRSAGSGVKYMIPDVFKAEAWFIDSFDH